MFIMSCSTFHCFFQSSRQSWAMKNFVPKESTQMPIVTDVSRSSTFQRNASSDESLPLLQLCDDLIFDHQQQLSPFVMDKSPLDMYDATTACQSSLGLDLKEVLDSVDSMNNLLLSPIGSQMVPPVAATLEFKREMCSSSEPETFSSPESSDTTSIRAAPGLAYVNGKPSIIVKISHSLTGNYPTKDKRRGPSAVADGIAGNGSSALEKGEMLMISPNAGAFAEFKSPKKEIMHSSCITGDNVSSEFTSFSSPFVKTEKLPSKISGTCADLDNLTVNLRGDYLKTESGDSGNFLKCEATVSEASNKTMKRKLENDGDLAEWKRRCDSNSSSAYKLGLVVANQKIICKESQ